MSAFKGSGLRFWGLGGAVLALPSCPHTPKCLDGRTGASGAPMCARRALRRLSQVSQFRV